MCRIPLFYWGKECETTKEQMNSNAGRERANAGSFVGVGGLFVALFLYGYAAIAWPSWLHSLVMPLLWLALFVLGCVWFSPHPRRAAWVAVAAFVLWFALILAFGVGG